MTDRELLENAAKAMGWSLFYYGTHCTVQTEPGKLMEWDPLTDDADALRLTVKLGLKVNLCVTKFAVQVGGVGTYVEIDFGNDPYAATRRAIVRAAAEIGKNL